ncbi:MAG TPA: TonB-dependent receptor, partial [Alteromonas sp.]|nr:TonB-dependent receptor [Alteromonas sp.]
YEGGAPLGQIYFVDANGNSLSPMADCESSLTFPYGGGGAVYDPACYPTNAIPVGSYRHTNYDKQRTGINIDAVWVAQIGDMENTLRAGLWYEDYERKENRSWQKIIDSRVGYQFDETPYWVQYSSEFPVETLMYYVEDEIDLGVATLRVGAKKFNVDIEKKDLFVPGNSLSVESDSDVLFSAGVVAPVMDGVEVFAGFAQNYAAIKDGVLESSSVDISSVEPETADNIDLGLRYVAADINVSLTYYNIDFDNRITYQSAEEAGGVDYLGELDGTYVNVGGVQSDGIEVAMDYTITNKLGLYFSYTQNNSEYKDPAASTGFVDGQRVVGSAEDMFVVSLDYTADVYNMGLSTKYVGERSAGSFEVDSYTVADFYLGATVDSPVQGISNIDIRLTINNLFDSSYLGTVVNGGAWIGAPRTAALNLKASF